MRCHGVEPDLSNQRYECLSFGSKGADVETLSEFIRIEPNSSAIA